MDATDLPLRPPGQSPELPPPLPPVGIMATVEGWWKCVNCGSIHGPAVSECECGESDTAIVVEVQ